jgi:hypothetical protein
MTRAIPARSEIAIGLGTPGNARFAEFSIEIAPLGAKLHFRLMIRAVRQRYDRY